MKTSNKNNPEKHGFAVSIGHLLYMTVWKVINYDSLTENKVGVMLTGDNYEIKLNAMYTSMDYDKKMEAIKKTLFNISKVPGKFKNIEELDINPFIVNEKEGVVVDARIVFSHV